MSWLISIYWITISKCEITSAHPNMHARYFSCFCCHTLTFFKINSYFKKSFRNTIECRMAWIYIRTQRMSALIWIQTVSKGYQQMTKVFPRKERDKFAIYVLKVLSFDLFKVPFSVVQIISCSQQQ